MLETMVAQVALPVVRVIYLKQDKAAAVALAAEDLMVVYLLVDLLYLDKVMQVKVIHMVFFLVEAAEALLKLVELTVMDKEEMVLQVH